MLFYPPTTIHCSINEDKQENETVVFNKQQFYKALVYVGSETGRERMREGFEDIGGFNDFAENLLLT